MKLNIEIEIPDEIMAEIERHADEATAGTVTGLESLKMHIEGFFFYRDEVKISILQA